MIPAGETRKRGVVQSIAPFVVYPGPVRRAGDKNFFTLW